VAVTSVSCRTEKIQSSIPEQGPAQPLKFESSSASALRVRFVPVEKIAEQVEPQSIPAGELVTVPLPGPDLVTSTVFVFGSIPPRTARTLKVVNLVLLFTNPFTNPTN